MILSSGQWAVFLTLAALTFFENCIYLFSLSSPLDGLPVDFHDGLDPKIEAFQGRLALSSLGSEADSSDFRLGDFLVVAHVVDFRLEGGVGKGREVEVDLTLVLDDIGEETGDIAAPSTSRVLSGKFPALALLLNRGDIVVVDTDSHLDLGELVDGGADSTLAHLAIAGDLKGENLTLHAQEGAHDRGEGSEKRSIGRVGSSLHGFSLVGYARIVGACLESQILFCGFDFILLDSEENAVLVFHDVHSVLDVSDSS